MDLNLSFKICGQSGQGIDTIGKILCNCFNSAGLFVVGYREYPSLIKGGNANFQIEVSNRPILSTRKKVDFVIVLNEQNMQWYEKDLMDSGYIFHNIKSPGFDYNSQKIIKNKRVEFGFINSDVIISKAGGSPKMKNIACVSKVCQMIGLPLSYLISSIKKEFRDDVISSKNIKVAQVSFDYNNLDFYSYNLSLHPKSSDIEMKTIEENEFIQKHSIIEFLKETDENINRKISTGNEAISYGAILAKVESFYAYPMTPSSSILSKLAEIGEKFGILVKQVDDEITASGMTLGAMMIGKRALTATSGGGFDLMSEHISFSMIAEIPFVIILAQRPGPATGLPTWTAQSDLLLAVNAGHGESPRIVIAVYDLKSCFEGIQTAFNLAQFYQIPVIILTDKYLAETYFQTETNKLEKFAVIDIVNTYNIDDENYHRYAITENGISPFWKIGTKTQTYLINSDEHNIDGNASEDAENAAFMTEKRNLKYEAIIDQMPDPLYYISQTDGVKKIKLISWGSTYSVIHDIIPLLEKESVKVEWMHVQYVWPLTQSINDFVDSDTVIIEGNYNSQLAKLIKMEFGKDISTKINKYDGRAFFKDELYEAIVDIIEKLN